MQFIPSGIKENVHVDEHESTKVPILIVHDKQPGVMSDPVDPTGCDDAAAHCPPPEDAPAVLHDAAADPAAYAIYLFYASLCDADATAATVDAPPLTADTAIPPRWSRFATGLT